jgi:hypothetical protein
MDKVNEYVVVTASSEVEFNKAVNQKIKEGWMLHCGISVVKNKLEDGNQTTPSFLFSQAMVK